MLKVYYIGAKEEREIVLLIHLLLFFSPLLLKRRKKMPIGFVLMRVSPKREQEVLDKLSKLFEIMEVHPLFGEYDFIAKVQSVGYEHIEEIVNKIRTIEGITDTQTLTRIKLQ